MERVIMLVHETNSVFGASFPDFPGCTTVADTLETLVAKAPSVLDFHVRGLKEDHLAIPEPRSLDALMEDATFLDDKADAVLATAIDVDLAGHSVNVGVAFPAEVLAAIDRAADRVGKTRSQFIADAALMRVDHL